MHQGRFVEGARHRPDVWELEQLGPRRYQETNAQLHRCDVFDQADVDGALAASVFHSGAIAIPELKRFLRQQDIEVRDV